MTQSELAFDRQAKCISIPIELQQKLSIKIKMQKTDLFVTLIYSRQTGCQHCQYTNAHKLHVHTELIIYAHLHQYAVQYSFPAISSRDYQCYSTNTHCSPAVALTSVDLEAGVVEFAHVKLHPDDGKHDNGEEEQQADLKQRNHGFHYGLQHHLET